MSSSWKMAILALCGVVGFSPASNANLGTRSSIVRPNSNTERAGVLRAGVLMIALEARKASYHIDGATHPPVETEAFSEPGKGPLMPGPLARAPAGTELRFSIRNTLDVALTFFVPAAVHHGADSFDAMDSVVVAPGATGHLSVRASAPRRPLQSIRR